MNHESKLCLITGASRGIGRAVVQALAELSEPPIVIAVARQPKSVDLIQKQLKQFGLQGSAFALDIADEAAVNNLFETIKQNYEADVDTLINNAGVTEDNLMLRMRDEQWHKVIDTNLTAVYRLCKKVLRPMIKNRFGRIINMSSVVATMGNPGQANYAASKAAVEALTKCIAHEVANRGITANSIAPGFIQTDMTTKLNEEQQHAILKNVPMQRMGTVEEIAHVVKFLLAKEASYITGSCIHVNGGPVML